MHITFLLNMTKFIKHKGLKAYYQIQKVGNEFKKPSILFKIYQFAYLNTHSFSLKKRLYAKSSIAVLQTG